MPRRQQRRRKRTKPLFTPNTRFKRGRSNRRRQRRRRTVNGAIRSNKRRMVTQGRRIDRLVRPLQNHAPNFQIFRTTNTSISFQSAYALSQATDTNVYGRWTRTLTLDDIMTGSQLAYITDNFNQINLLSLTIRVQIRYIENPSILAPTAVGQTNIGFIPLSSSISTVPEIYLRTTYDAYDPVPIGGTAGSGAAASMRTARTQWTIAPRVKTLVQRKSASMYWTCPTNKRSDVINTEGLAIGNGITVLTTTLPMQKPKQIDFFWADFVRYINNSATETCVVNFAIQCQAMFKLSGNKSFTSS